MVKPFESWFAEQKSPEQQEHDDIMENYPRIRCCRCDQTVEFLPDKELYVETVLADDYHCGGNPWCCP